MLLSCRAMNTGHTLPELVAVMKRLLAPDGCPWDRQQTLETLKTYLLAETYEVIDAIDAADVPLHREELGDLLMQIVFQTELRSAEGSFDVDDVIKEISEKLRRRHPHVFGVGEPKLETAEQVLAQWTELKRQEKPRRALEGVPRSLPALARAASLTERAAQVGFDWPDNSGARQKIDEELAELDRAIAANATGDIAAEVGDVLLAVVNLARKLAVDPEISLRATTDRFVRRFDYVEDRLREQNREPRDASLAEMDAKWEEAKRSEAVNAHHAAKK
ncbi:MAG: nucleoside triphosphate pyrophosphohydrolase [Pseudomonadota bacterium]